MDLLLRLGVGAVPVAAVRGSVPVAMAATLVGLRCGGGNSRVAVAVPSTLSSKLRISTKILPS